MNEDHSTRSPGDDPGPPDGARDPGPPDGSAPGPPEGRDPGPPDGVTPGADPGPPGGAPGPGGDPGPPDGEDPFALPKLKKEDIAFFWPYLAPDRGKVFGALATMIFQAAVPVGMMLLPWWLSRYWSQGFEHMLVWGLVALIVLNIVAMGVQFLGTYLISSSSEGFVRRVALSIYRKVGELSSQQVSSQSIGEFAQRITGDLMRIQDLISPGLIRGVVDVLQILFMFIALFIMGPAYALIVLIALPVMLWGVRKVNQRVAKWARKDQLQHQQIMTRFIESIGGYRDLVAAGRFGHAAERFGEELGKRQRIAVRTSMWNVTAGVVPMFGFFVLVFAYYFINVTDPSMLADFENMGVMLSFAGLIGMARQPVLGLFGLYTESSLAAPSLFEVRRLLEAPTQTQVETSAPVRDNAIEFDRVSFGYQPWDPPVLADMSFRIEPGSFVGIVGESGGGKTTMFHLLVRLLEPTRGVIRLGGAPLGEISLADLRDIVGFIPQNPFIFDGTIRENLLMGVPEEAIDAATLDRAVKLAQLEPLLAKRADQGGMDAQAGAAGSSLSGGERQRVALARVFLRDPNVIVCDEYTANVDTSTARLIHEALTTEFRAATRVVVTHQLHAIRGADKILVLDRGGIGDQGTHEELVQRCDLYRRMYELQRVE